MIQKFWQFYLRQVWLGLAVGVISSMVIGACRAGSGMAIALLPVTYSMEPVAALVMVILIYTAAMTEVPSRRFFSTRPALPANAATAIEGYP